MKKHIVTIGGGTGSYTLLTGLKKYPVDLTAIVTMADDGGSSGVLRDELGVLPPGDVRQCLVALSDAPETLRNLFLYRFESGGLAGHNFGNLFLSALEKINGNIEDAITEAEHILRVQGKVIPVTTDNARLVMQLNNGTRLVGESEIYRNSTIQRKGIKKIHFTKKVSITPAARNAILRADKIVIGPGDFYSSIVPNLIVRGISDALKKTSGKIVFVANLTNKRGQTTGFSITDYLGQLSRMLRGVIVHYAIVNSEKPEQRLYDKYEKQEGIGFWIDSFGSNRSSETRILKRRLLSKKIIVHAKSDALSKQRSFIRHDSDRLARIIMDI